MRFPGCWAKLRRADQHLLELKRRVVLFETQHRYTGQLKIDYAAGTAVYALVDAPQPPSDEWAPVIGDAVHNLHSSLEHLICALVSGDCDKLSFPVIETNAADFWQKWRAFPGIAAVLEGDARAIESVQPYNDLHPGGLGPECIGLLHGLWNYDKHRALLVASKNLVAAVANIRSQDVVVLSETTRSSTYLGPDIIDVTFSVTGPNPSLQMRPEIMTQLRFAGPPEKVRGRSLLPTLFGIRNFVNQRLFEKLDADFKVPALSSA